MLPVKARARDAQAGAGEPAEQAPARGRALVSAPWSVQRHLFAVGSSQALAAAA